MHTHTQLWAVQPETNKRIPRKRTKKFTTRKKKVKYKNIERIRVKTSKPKAFQTVGNYKENKIQKCSHHQLVKYPIKIEKQKNLTGIGEKSEKWDMTLRFVFFLPLFERSKRRHRTLSMHKTHSWFSSHVIPYHHCSGTRPSISISVIG